MVGRTKPARGDEKLRMDLIKHYIGCLPSLLRGFPNGHATVQHVVEGRKRLGHRYTYGASKWHHLGYCRGGLGVEEMTRRYGPSLAHNPRQYHDEFGTEHELVALTDKAIELFQSSPWEPFDMPYSVATELQQFHLEQRAVT